MYQSVYNTQDLKGVQDLINFKKIHLFIFNWRMIALQYCVGFCHLSTQISHRYTYVPSLLNSPLTSHPISALYFVTQHQIWGPWIIYQNPTGYLFYTG